jgi:phosphatidylserine synthase
LQSVLPFFAIVVALLMVSRIPYPHVVNQVFRGQRSFGFLVAVLFALVAVMVRRDYSIPIIVCGFVFFGPVRFCWQKIVQRRRQEEEDSLF